MTGLIFLVIGGLWIAISGYLATSIPRWLGIRRLRWLIGLMFLPALLVAPFLDEFVGMRQFEKLCIERAVMHVSPGAYQVSQAKRLEPRYSDIPGYWIKIISQSEVYVDVVTGVPFLSYEILHTKGGHIAGIALMGGAHSCSPKDMSEMNRLDTEKLIRQGKNNGVN